MHLFFLLVVVLNAADNSDKSKLDFLESQKKIVLNFIDSSVDSKSPKKYSLEWPSYDMELMSKIEEVIKKDDKKNAGNHIRRVLMYIEMREKLEEEFFVFLQDEEIPDVTKDLIGPPDKFYDWFLLYIYDKNRKKNLLYKDHLLSEKEKFTERDWMYTWEIDKYFDKNKDQINKIYSMRYSYNEFGKKIIFDLRKDLLSMDEYVQARVVPFFNSHFNTEDVHETCLGEEAIFAYLPVNNVRIKYTLYLKFKKYHLLEKNE